MSGEVARGFAAMWVRESAVACSTFSSISKSGFMSRLAAYHWLADECV